MFFFFYSAQLIEDDIAGHRAAIDSITRAATQIMQNSEPKLAKALNSKLDSLKTRYDRVSTSTQNHGKLVQGMTDRLTEFEKEVDSLEDWLLPTIDLLESREMSGMDLDGLEKKLKVRRRLHCKCVTGFVSFIACCRWLQLYVFYVKVILMWEGDNIMLIFIDM